MITPDNRTIAYTYDANNLLTQIETPDMGNFAFAYDAANRRTTRTLPNGTVSTYSYDFDGRLTGIQTTLNQTTIDSVTYTLDNVGNRTAKTQNSNSYSYTYDNIYRLTQATPTTGVQENYTYDAVGNRTTGGNEQFPQTNQTIVYSYDDENRLTGVTITQGSLVKQLTFAYDPFGRRIKKTIVHDTIGTDCTSPNTCPRTTNYVYDSQIIIMEYDQNNNITTKYTHGPRIDEPLAVQQGTAIYYYHADGLGSITGLSNTSGTIVQIYTYDSFGNMTQTGSISQPFTYTAREYDQETGMYFYRARYYDPKVGRFVTKDPIGFAGGDVNLYNYVGANPVNWIDPMGLTQEDINNMLNLVKDTQSDLKAPDEIYTSSFWWSKDTEGYTNPITLNITIHEKYLETLNCDQLKDLFNLIVHETIHRTRSRYDMILRPILHPDIYKDAEERTKRVSDKIKAQCECDGKK